MLKKLCMVLVAVAMTGCAMVVPSPVTGTAYTNLSGPLAVTNSTNEPTRVGRSTVKSIFGFIATGDASIQTAAKNGGITEIHHVDFEAQSVFGVIAEYTVVVYGN